MDGQLWEAVGERLSGLDELTVAKTRIRMAKAGETVPVEQAVSVVQSSAEFPYRLAEFRNLEVSATADLESTRRRLAYLANLHKEMVHKPQQLAHLRGAAVSSSMMATELSSGGGGGSGGGGDGGGGDSSGSTGGAAGGGMAATSTIAASSDVRQCPLCDEDITGKRKASVLHCGHILCADCIGKLKRATTSGARPATSLSSTTTAVAAVVSVGAVGSGLRHRDSAAVGGAASSSDPLSAPHKKKKKQSKSSVKCPWCRTVHSIDDIHEIGRASRQVRACVRACVRIGTCTHVGGFLPSFLPSFLHVVW